MANGPDLSRHLDDSEELCGLQAPQVQVVGFASSSQGSAISGHSKHFVYDARAFRWGWQLVLAKQSVTLPGEDGVIFKAAEDGVTEREKENLETEKVTFHPGSTQSS